MNQVNEVSAEIIFPRIKLFIQCIFASVFVYSIFFVMDFTIQICDSLGLISNTTKNRRRLENLQNAIDKTFPCLIFSILNIIHYGNFKFCTFLTFLITTLSLLRYLGESRIKSELVQIFDKCIYGSVIVQFCIFVFTDQDKL